MDHPASTVSEVNTKKLTKEYFWTSRLANQTPTIAQFGDKVIDTMERIAQMETEDEFKFNVIRNWSPSQELERSH